MDFKKIFTKTSNVKDISGIINLESGTIKSFLDSWTFEHALLELSDNANDANCDKFEITQLKSENGKYYVIIQYNGIPFTYDSLYDYLRVFSYHVALMNNTAGLRGCGRRWAFYTLSGYRNWTKETDSNVSVFSYNKETKELYKGSLTIRYPNQKNDDVKMFSPIEQTKWGKWWNNMLLIEIENPIRMEEYAKEIEIAYPINPTTTFIIKDLINDFKATVNPIDRSFGIDVLRNDKFWKGIDNGIKEIEYDEGLKCLLSYGTAPCGKKFKIVTSVLSTDFLKENGERTVKGGAKHIYGGLYAFRGNRFIVHGNSKHLGNLLPDRGGCGNVRTIVDLSDDDVANDFGVRTNKSLGIENLENSVKLNPNNTRLDGSSDERRQDKVNNGKTVLGVYDYILNSSRKGYKLYCDEFTKPIVKTHETKKEIKNKKPSVSKSEILEQIGEVKAVEPKQFILTEYDIFNSDKFEFVLDRVLDELELMGVEIPGDAHKKIMNKLCSKSKIEKEWADVLCKV